MIFKTFDSNIDKISSKWGILGRSFNDIGTTIRNKIISFNEEFEQTGKIFNSWKNSDSIWSKLYPNKENIKAQLIDVDKLIPKIDVNSFDFNKWIKELNDIDKSVKAGTLSWQEYSDGLDDNQKWIAKWGQETDGQIRTQSDLVKANEAARASALAQNEAIKAQTFSAKAQAAALKLTSIALNMAATWAISKGIEFAVNWIDSLTHSAERCKERVDDLMSSYQSALNTANNNAKTIEGLAGKYEELSKGVDNLGKNISLTTEEYAEYNDIVNQIADMFPTLVQGYTNEGNAILSLKGNVEALRDAYKEAQQEAYNMLIVSGKDSDGNDIIKNWKNLQETSGWNKFWDFGADDVGKGISITDAVKELEAFSKISAEAYRNIRIKQTEAVGNPEALSSLSADEKIVAYSNYLDKALGITFSYNINDEDFAQVQKQARVLAQTYNAEIQSALKDVRTLANAYLMTNESYYSLDSDVRSAASVIVNSLNANIASQFEDKNAVGEYVDNIVQMLCDNSDSDSNVSEALVSLFKLNYSDMPIGEAKAFIDKYIKLISDMLGDENAIELKIQLGFTEIDELKENYDRILYEAAKKFTGITDREIITDDGKYDEYNQIYSKLDAFATEHSINTQDELAAFAKALEDANYDIEQAFVNYLTTSEVSKELTPFTTLSEGQSAAIEAYKKDLASITDIFENSRDVGITELMSTFEGYDWSECLSGAEDLDTALRNIASQGLQAVIDQFEGFSECEKILDEMKQKFEETFRFDFGLSENLAAYDELTHLLERVRNSEALQKDEIAGLIKKYPELSSVVEEIKEGYGLEESAIVSLINRYGENVNAGIAANQALKESTVKSIQAQIAAYESLLQSQGLATSGSAKKNIQHANLMGGISKFNFFKEDPVRIVDTEGNIAMSPDELAIRKELADLNRQLQDLLDSDEYKVDFKPTIEATTEDVSSSSSKQVFDWIEKAVSNAANKLEGLKSKISDIYQTWASRNNAVDNAIKQTKENSQTSKDAYNKYMAKANSIGLPKEWQNKVKEGALDISELDPSKEYGGISGATLIQQIQDFQEWYGKAKACDEEAKSLNTELKDLAKTRFDNLKIPFDNKNARINSKQDKVKSKIDTIEAGGGYLTNGSYYEELIRLEEKEKQNLVKKRKKLNQELKDKVADGTIEKDSEAYEEMLADIRECTSGVLECNKNIAGWEKTIQDISFDMSERHLGRLDDILDGMKDKISDTSLTWEERNKAIDDSAKQTAKNIKEYEKDIAGWQEEADAIALSDEWKEKIIGGDYDLTGIKDEALLALIQQFETLWEQIKKGQDKVDGLNGSFKDLAKARVDNITTQFDGILADFEHRKNMIEGDIGIVQAKGHLVGAGYYSALKGTEENNLAALRAEREQLMEAMNAPIDGNGNFLKKGSEGYKELKKQVNFVTKEIQDSEKALIDYDNEIRQIAWDMADFIQETISQLTNEADFYIDLMKNKDLYSDDGKLNDYGMATLGMHGLNYNTYMEQSVGYARELEELEKQLADDPYNKDLIERYRERLDLQHDMVLAAEDEKQAMIDMVRDGIDAELDSLKDLIDTYKDALDAQKDLYDFQKKVDSQTQKISDIEKQILAYENDSSEEAKSKIQQLKVNLADAKEDLEDTQYDKYISDQKELLDGLYQDYEDALNQRLDDVDALFESLIADVNANSDSIKETLAAEAEKVGLDLSNEMETIWNQPSKGESDISDALKVYKGDFDGYKQAFGTYVDSFQKYYTEYGTKSKEQNEKLDNIDGRVKDASENEINALGEVKADIETVDGSLTGYAAQETERYTTLEDLFTKIKDAAENINTLIHSNDFPSAVHTAIGTLNTSITTGFSNLADAYSAAAKAANATIRNTNQDTDNTIGYPSNGSVFTPLGRTDTYPKDKLDKENSIEDRLRWYGFEYDFKARERYYSALGGSGKYEGTAKQNQWLLDKMKSMGYKKGVYDLKQDETAWTQEGQPELIRTSDGAMLIPLKAGSTVFDGIATKNLFDFGNAPVDFLRRYSPTLPNPSIISKAGSSLSSEKYVELNLTLPNVTNYEDFVYRMQHDKRITRWLQDDTVNLLNGGSTMAKYMHGIK